MFSEFLIFFEFIASKQLDIFKLKISEQFEFKLEALRYLF